VSSASSVNSVILTKKTTLNRKLPIKHIGYILFQNPQPLPIPSNPCYTTITMKNATTYKRNHIQTQPHTNATLLKRKTIYLYQKQTITSKNKRYSISSFLRHSNPMKTTHKPRQAQQSDHNTVKIQLCKISRKTVSF